MDVSVKVHLDHFRRLQDVGHAKTGAMRNKREEAIRRVQEVVVGCRRVVDELDQVYKQLTPSQAISRLAAP